MTREEEIRLTADKYCLDEYTRLGFVAGAEWADAHPHWLSVEDELPKINPNGSEWEYSDDVIVALKDGSIAVGRYERYNSTGEHYWMLYGVGKDLIVTHWMPLPEAPLVTDLNKKDLPPVSWQEGNILVEEEGDKEERYKHYYNEGYNAGCVKGYEQAIKKACEWLDCYIDNYLFIDAENKAGIKWDDFINDFRKAMKGGENENN